MIDKIRSQIKKIEENENVKVLYAVESGSRAWGFESVDSDYDVRFIYLHNINWYLSIHEKRDVLEYPINELLDISGWDLKKSLQLMLKSNPALYEWLESPIKYVVNEEFHSEIVALSREYFSEKSAMYHYLNMAKQNFKKHFSSDEVKIKRYFYVLRPIFACRWIEEKKEFPPIRFELLYKEIAEKNIVKEIESLLDKKKNCNEYDLESKNLILDEYISKNISYYEQYLKKLTKTEKNSEMLDEYFVNCLKKYV